MEKGPASQLNLKGRDSLSRDTGFMMISGMPILCARRRNIGENSRRAFLIPEELSKLSKIPKYGYSLVDDGRGLSTGQ